MVSAQQTQAQKINELMADIKAVINTTNEIQRSLAVHDQRHVALDAEHTSMLGLLTDHSKRLTVVEHASNQNKRDIERLTALAEKLIWAFATPIILAIVSGLVYALAQAAR